MGRTATWSRGGAWCGGGWLPWWRLGCSRAWASPPVAVHNQSGAAEPGSGSQGSNQGAYVASVLKDRDFLFDGFVVTPRGFRNELNKPLAVKVSVCGALARSGDCNISASAIPPGVLPTPSATSTFAATPAATSAAPRQSSGGRSTMTCLDHRAGQSPKNVGEDAPSPVIF